MTNLRNLIDIFEDPTLKKEIIDAVKKTDDTQLLQKILNTLTVGDLPIRLREILRKDADASKFAESIAKVIMHMDNPNSDKMAFLENYATGFINTDLLLDGQQHNYREFINSPLALDLFKILSTQLVSQGVGPCEVAFAVLSPKIRWSGRAGGGGDIQVNKIAVEVKARVASGGRWINARKATIDMAGIRRAMDDAWTKSKNPEPLDMPDRTNFSYWVQNIRPKIDPKLLPKLAKQMADGLFNHTNNTEYRDALIEGDVARIQDALLNVGFENYKAYSDFDGILLVDVPSETAQYFRSYGEMRGYAKAGQGYVYAPESEAMPQVVLIPKGGVGTPTGRRPAAADAKPAASPVAKPKSLSGEPVSIRPPGTPDLSTKPTRDISAPRARRSR
jgi:hypothetical protein